MDAKSAKRESCLLPPSLSAPARARDFVFTALSLWGVERVFADVPLLTSELVTNAVLHAQTDVGLTIDLEADHVRVEVHDLSELPPVMGDLAEARSGGWGLHIVERLATRWGLEPGPIGKTIWCEVARPS